MRNRSLNGNGSATTFHSIDASGQWNAEAEIRYLTSSDLSSGDLDPQSLSVYPNPASEEIRVPGTTEKGTLRVMDMSGNRIMEREITEQNQRVNIESLSSGTCLLQLKTSSGSSNTRLIVE